MKFILLVLLLPVLVLGDAIDNICRDSGKCWLLDGIKPCSDPSTLESQRDVANCYRKLIAYAWKKIPESMKRFKLGDKEIEIRIFDPWFDITDNFATEYARTGFSIMIPDDINMENITKYIGYMKPQSDWIDHRSLRCGQYYGMSLNMKSLFEIESVDFVANDYTYDRDEGRGGSGKCGFYDDEYFKIYSSPEYKKSWITTEGKIGMLNLPSTLYMLKFQDEAYSKKNAMCGALCNMGKFLRDNANNFAKNPESTCESMGTACQMVKDVFLRAPVPGVVGPNEVTQECLTSSPSRDCDDDFEHSRLLNPLRFASTSPRLVDQS